MIKQKKLLVYCIIAIIAIVVVLTGCSSNTDSKLLEEKNADAEEYIDKGDSDDNKQIVISTSRYIPNQVEKGMQYDYSVSLDNRYFAYYFYLGTITDTPIFTSPAKKYSYDGQEMEITLSKSTLEQITETTSLAVETINTKSYTGGFEISFKENIKANIPFLVSSSFETSQSTSHHWTNNSGNIVTRNEENAKSYATQLTQEYTIKYVFNEENGFKQGYSYRETLLEIVDVFAIVTYDKQYDKYEYGFKPYISDNKDITFVTEQSDEFGSFRNTTSNDNLHFDLQEAIDFIENYIEQPDSQLKSEEFVAANILGFDGGLGTEQKPYVIAGKIKPADEQFSLIGNHLDKHFILKTDVDLSKYSPRNNLFNAIIKGNFTGSINGNNQKLQSLNWNLHFQNVTPNSNEKFYYRIGIFEQMNGTIKNLFIENCNIIFSSYHEKDNQLYAFGILAACSNGKINDVELKNCELQVHRAQSRSGLIVGANYGELNNCSVLSSKLFVNGDGAAIAGNNYGLINECKVDNSILQFYGVKHNGQTYGTSLGGISATINNNATIRLCTITNSQFIVNNTNNVNPKIGYIVGHAMNGNIHNVGELNCNKNLTGKTGSYYFKVGWGWAGRINEGVDVI